ncbi:PspC domain-containing protein [Ferruginibacter albus]|uniref:PspC domain-containing protein n=1 Tax=Ferruginibacter albus TaxID=2875540 RepID=UPI001CC45317|nr:PspC domain-containing protein [Ferruginibacter albus]UAY52114.1 PspC domain-containing protein [Ferruginibacter albus]
MKQVININFQGQVVPIEVSAFELLKNYTESLRAYFANEEGRDEIINDIENRISELFQETLKKGATCITDDDINAVIKSIGRPEDFGDAESTKQDSKENFQQSSATTNTTATHKRLYRDENNKILGGVCSGVASYLGIDTIVVRIITVIFGGPLLVPYVLVWVFVPSSSSLEIGGTRKKFYRDSDDKIIAGVCSGIGNYLGINPWIPRILFLIPFLSFAFHWSHWVFFNFPSILRFSFSPGAFIFYIILWMVIPEATTTAEKLEMKGEKVDLNSIKNSVMEEMKGVKDRAEKFGQEAKAYASERGKNVGADINVAVKRSSRSLGDIIVLILKIFGYFIIGVVVFFLLLALLAIVIGAVSVFPLKNFFIADGWQNICAWGTLLFFIGAPFIGLITWIIRRLAKVKNNRKLLRLTFICLWILGWASAICLLVSITKDFKYKNDGIEQNLVLANPAVNKLEVTANYPVKNHSSNWFRIDGDSAYMKNIGIQILKSSNDSFSVTVKKLANGNRKSAAEITADLISFNGRQVDSLLVLDRYISFSEKEKFRNQRVLVTIYVPVGKQILVDESTGQMADINIGWNDNNDNVDIDWNDDEYPKLKKNIYYTMHADGNLYTLRGEQVTGNKINSENDDMGDEKENKMDSLQNIMDSLQNIAERKKDSIEKALEKELNNEKRKIQRQQPSTYMKPTGSPIGSFM